eukprot:996969-Prorocentrum_minimum.AAC.5
MKDRGSSKRNIIGRFIWSISELKISNGLEWHILDVARPRSDARPDFTGPIEARRSPGRRGGPGKEAAQRQGSISHTLGIPMYMYMYMYYHPVAIIWYHGIP